MNPWEASAADTKTADGDRDQSAAGWVKPLTTTGLAWRDLPPRQSASRATPIAVLDRLPDRSQAASAPHLLLVGLRLAGLPVLGWCRVGGDDARIDSVHYHAALPQAADAAPADRVARWLDDLLPAWLADHGPSAVLAGLDDGLVTTAAALRVAAATGIPSLLRLDSQTAEPLLAAGLAARASRIVAVDDETRRIAVAAGVPETRIDVVPDPLDVDAAQVAHGPELQDDLGVDGIRIGLLIDEHTDEPLDFLTALSPRLHSVATTFILLGQQAREQTDEILRLAPSDVRVIRPAGSFDDATNVHRLGLGLTVDCRRKDDGMSAQLRAAGVPVLSLSEESEDRGPGFASLSQQAAELVANPSRRLLASDTERARACRERSPEVVGDRYAAVLKRIQAAT